MPKPSRPSSLPAPAAAVSHSATIRRHGLYLATMVAYFRVAGAAKYPRPAPPPIPTGALHPLRSI